MQLLNTLVEPVLLLLLLMEQLLVAFVVGIHFLLVFSLFELELLLVKLLQPVDLSFALQVDLVVLLVHVG